MPSQSHLLAMDAGSHRIGAPQETRLGFHSWTNGFDVDHDGSTRDHLLSIAAPDSIVYTVLNGGLCRSAAGHTSSSSSSASASSPQVLVLPLTSDSRCRLATRLDAAPASRRPSISVTWWWCWSCACMAHNAGRTHAPRVPPRRSAACRRREEASSSLTQCNDGHTPVRSTRLHTKHATTGSSSNEAAGGDGRRHDGHEQARLHASQRGCSELAASSFRDEDDTRLTLRH